MLKRCPSYRESNKGGKERQGPPGGYYDGLYGEAPLESSIFFRLQVYERVEISLVEVYTGVGKSVIWVCERAQFQKG